MGSVPTVIRRVPVFALEDYVLLPYTVAALQVFDAAGRDLIDDSQATDRMMVVTGLAENWRQMEGGSPPLLPIAGLGKIVSVRPLDDGSREVYLHGVARVRLTRIHREHPYRIGEAERLEDDVSRAERRRMRAAQRRLHDYLNALVRSGYGGSELSRIISASDDLDVLSYRLGAMLIDAPTERQRLLETCSVAGRLEQLVEAVARLLMREEEQQPATELPAYIN